MQLRRTVQLAVTCVFLIAAYQIPATLTAYGASAGGGASANLSLNDASATLMQTGTSGWTLDKSGSLSGDTITWNITVEKVDTASGHLLFNGQMTIFNDGSAPATLGNIVVNLQKRVGNKWTTVSSDIADAANGDAASGALMFMDASSNTEFSLKPQVQVPAGQGLSLLFQASFNNNTLNIPAGTAVRAEVIVTFGNAAANRNSAANLDINGNGVIDSDEARVRSVPTRLSVVVPGPFNGNANVTITDTVGDIKASGTATFDNVSFNLCAMTCTVTANVDGGANGGSVTNCARLTSGGTPVPTLNQNQCSTIQVRASACTPGAPGCGWSNGDMRTATQDVWGDSVTTDGATLQANFDTIYPNDLTVGEPFTLTLTESGKVFSFLPTLGTAASLNGSISDPQTTSAGEFAGQVVALRLNVDFSSVFGNSVDFGSLLICNVASQPSLNGQSINQFLATANHLLGGGSATIDSSTANAVARFLNGAFVDGVPSTFAQNNLFAGACP